MHFVTVVRHIDRDILLAAILIGSILYLIGVRIAESIDELRKGIMATVDDVTASLNALTAEVQAVSAIGPGAATPAQLDAIKTAVDSATASLKTAFPGT